MDCPFHATLVVLHRTSTVGSGYNHCLALFDDIIGHLAAHVAGDVGLGGNGMHIYSIPKSFSHSYANSLAVLQEPCL
jgi:hypothetical protein